MSTYFEDEQVSVYHGDCIDVMRTLPAESVDAIVTDPPYGIRFMGQAWDGADILERQERGKRTSPMPDGVGGPNGGYRSLAAEAGRYNQTIQSTRAFQAWCTEWATECLRVLKPGGHLLAFGSPRAWHRLTTGIEDAGFEIRDSIAWLYGSGFPKNRNVSADLDLLGSTESASWEGWGTALKPAFEPCVVARKPLCGTVARNVLDYGTGALNIDATRIHTPGSEGRSYSVRRLKSGAELSRTGGSWRPDDRDARYEGHTKDGKWPTNVTLDSAAAAQLDAENPHSVSTVGKPRSSRSSGDGWGMTATGNEYADEGGPSRFFPTFRFEAKAPTSERPSMNGVQHPTVKPLALMQWLVRLVAPRGSLVLDPFAGSGTTLEACLSEGMRCIGIEREEKYLPLIRERLTKDIAIALDFGGWTA